MDRVCAGDAADMTTIRITQHLPYPAEAVWALIGDFGGLHRWHPRVRRLDLSWEGRIRTLHYDDGSRVVERLEARNDAARRYVYVLVDGAFPVASCRSTLEVRARNWHCVVAWSSEFEAPDGEEIRARAALRLHHGQGLGALAAALAPDADSA